MTTAASAPGRGSTDSGLLAASGAAFPPAGARTGEHRHGINRFPAPDFEKQRGHFIFTDEHDQLRDSIRRFAVKELAPHADEWEDTTFPNSVFTRMGELGFLGLNKPVEYGGQGGDYYTAIVLAEELVHSDSGGLLMGVDVHTEMALPPVLEFGTEEQKQEWAVPAIAGEKILCIAITEPDVGSDVVAVKTRAVQGRRRLRHQRLEDVHHQRPPCRL